ncbi:MAG: transglycosylase SLT domain-containing protein [Candidatus Magasanikbacteria bacterium]|nr:transglycosylase SLT domain-containing protein [Candidatus Magasanikbacteria bacterium]
MEKIPIESMVFENHDPITPATPTTGSAKGLATTAYDATFQAFANCAGIDWRIYKAFAYKESGLNPEAKGGKTGKFIGLFQVFQPYCKDALKKIKWDIYCDSPGLTNPWVNNAYAALLADKNVAKIEGTCSSTSAPDKFFMLYIGHNCGPGALSSLLKIGCDINKWMASPPGNCSLGKMNFAKSVTGVIQQLGASSFKTAPENSDLTKCPFKSGLPNINSTNATDSTTDTSKPTAGGTDWTASCPSSPHKILAVGDSITADANSYIDQLQKGCGGKISFEKIAKSGEQTLWMYDQIKDKQNLQSEGFTDLFILGGVNDIASGVNENAIKKRLTNIYNFGKNQQLKVTAITIIPWKTYPTWTPPDQAITENVNSWIKSQQGNLIDEIIDYYSLAVDTNDPGAAKSGWTKDGLHPSKTGHKALAEAAAASL